ncbi:MAG: 50S ribosomal protein L4, partial [Fidelibacterota bacterium]
QSLGLQGKKVMILVGEPTGELWLAARNLPGVGVKPAVDVSTYDVWSTDYLLVDTAGIKNLNVALG